MAACETRDGILLLRNQAQGGPNPVTTAHILKSKSNINFQFCVFNNMPAESKSNQIVFHSCREQTTYCRAEWQALQKAEWAPEMIFI